MSVWFQAKHIPVNNPRQSYIKGIMHTEILMGDFVPGPGDILSKGEDIVTVWRLSQYGGCHSMDIVTVWGFFSMGNFN